MIRRIGLLGLILCSLVGLASAPHSVRAETVPVSRSQIQLSFAPVVDHVAPSVVNIYAKRMVTTRASLFGDPFFDQFFGGGRGGGLGMPRQRLENSLGSGVIVDSSGLVVTNAHVVDGAQEIVVVLKDGRELDAAIRVLDKPSDLALLRLIAPPADLPAARLRSSNGLAVGDLVLAIGNPFGVGQTVTSGIISALASSAVHVGSFNFFIQTDAAINPGNSGGPLVAMDGGVIGINSAIYSKDGGSLGIGFAIPSEMVLSVIAAEKAGTVTDTPDGGRIQRAWFGITVQNVTADIARAIGLDRPHGVLVRAVHPASPLAATGLDKGDVITAVNGSPVRDEAELAFRLATVPINDTLTIDYRTEGGQSRNAQLKAIAAPDNPPRNPQTVQGKTPLSGARVVALNPAVLDEFGLPPDSAMQGVIIESIAPRSPATRFFRVGQILLEVNGVPLTDPAMTQRAAERATPEGWIAVIRVGDQTQRLVLR